MRRLRTTILLLLALAPVSVYGDVVYFGGAGDARTHWVGYRVSLGTNSIQWTAYVLDPAKRGRIQIAPATFRQVGTNTWTAIFDETAFHGKEARMGLASHTLRITYGPDPDVLKLQDGADTLQLRKMSGADLKTLESGRIPNPRGGASER